MVGQTEIRAERRMATQEPVLFSTPRRAPRYYFGGAAELTDLESGRMTVALVRTLSLYGCFIRTDKPFRLGAKIGLRITDSEHQFSATAARIVNQANDGFGVEFTEMGTTDKAQLESCLSELERRDQVSDFGWSSGVLVVDDNSVTRSTIRSMLQGHGLPICGEAENGMQAVERVKELNPEVVLLDIEMPVMNGIQAAHEIRRISPSTKILFFTVHNDDATCGVRVLGVDGVVTKSAAATDLIPALKRLVQA